MYTRDAARHGHDLRNVVELCLCRKMMPMCVTVHDASAFYINLVYAVNRRGTTLRYKTLRRIYLYISNVQVLRRSVASPLFYFTLRDANNLSTLLTTSTMTRMRDKRALGHERTPSRVEENTT
jgi:hypothetical protein